jgi:hypothetical protein
MLTPRVGQAARPNETPQIAAEIRAAASGGGVNPAFLEALAKAESGLRPDEKARSSSASGLYQFIESTWLDLLHRHGPKYGLIEPGAISVSADRSGASRYVFATAAQRAAALELRHDVRASSVMAAEFTRENFDQMEAVLGRAPHPAELYLAHFLGSSDAGRFLDARSATPAALGADLFNGAARSNPGVFYRPDGAPRSIGEIFDFFAAKFPAVDSVSASVPSAVPASAVARASAPVADRSPQLAAKLIAFQEAARVLLSVDFTWAGD